MIKYILKRILQVIPVLIGVSFLVFFLMSNARGDAVSAIAGPDATIEQMEQIREEMGLNDPLLVQYGRYMLNILKGDMGQSYISKRDVFQTYISYLPKTVELAVAGIIVALIIAIPLGIISALHRGSLIDGISMFTALVGLSMPNFWLGLLLIIVFALGLGWFPSSGAKTFASLVLPAITVGTGQAAIITRTTRSSMLDVIGQDYIRTAKAKGVPYRRVIIKHALRNALIPIITVTGTQLGATLGGAVLTESVFSWPGVGRLIIDSINQRDTPMVTGCLILTTMLVSLTILLIDIIYAFVDPKIKAMYTK